MEETPKPLVFGGDKTPPLCLEEVRSGGIEVGGIALLVQAEPLVYCFAVHALGCTRINMGIGVKNMQSA